MKHEKIFNGLVGLDEKLKNLQGFIGKMEGHKSDPAKDAEADDKWGEMALEEFLADGANEMIRHILQRIENTDMRLRAIIEDEIGEEKT